MKKVFLFLVCQAIFFYVAPAQNTKYIVRFKDKAGTPFSLNTPTAYLGPRAIQRRAKYNIAIDSTDLPITPRYIDSLRLAGNVIILNASKWLNQVAIKTTDAAALAKISSFPFVQSTTGIAAKTALENIPVLKEQLGNASQQEGINLLPAGINGTDVYSYGLSHGQVYLHQGAFLHNHGFTGAGMQMAVLDAGFYHYQTLRTFDSIRNNNQILGTWDFVANEQSVNEDDTHGMQCLSTIAANMPGIFMGTAPSTSFYLYRTEDVFSETQIEEQNYAAGLERADSTGVDITSTSLGYNQFDNPSTNYTYADMNGNVTISARAADLAAKKGIMMVIAVGNEGQKPWRYLTTPSDGDSVMAVGAVDTLRNVAGFSSHGTSSDGQVKPNVAAVGLRAVVANLNGDPSFGNGTSFATPNMAGLTTCLMQAYPEYSNMDVLNAMQLSASRAANPDTLVGYGIPDMKKAFVLLQKKSYSKQLTVTNCTASLLIKIKLDKTMNVVLEKKAEGETAYSSFKTTAGTGNYSQREILFTDDLILSAAGNNNYRVRINIAGDTSFYADSLIVPVTTLCSNPQNSVKILPNPVVNNINVAVSRSAASTINIVLRNAAGQRLYSKTYQQPSGAQTQNIDVSKLSSGVYFVSVFADGKKVWVEKFVK